MQDIWEKLIFWVFGAGVIFNCTKILQETFLVYNLMRNDFALLTFSYKMIPMRDICENLCFWTSEVPCGTKLPWDRCRFLIC